MLLATRHKQTHPALTPASRAGIQFTFHEGMEGWVDLSDLINDYAPAGSRTRDRCANFTYSRYGGDAGEFADPWSQSMGLDAVV